MLTNKSPLILMSRYVHIWYYKDSETLPHIGGKHLERLNEKFDICNKLIVLTCNISYYIN